MFDSLAHPHLDTQRGEYPSFLEWKHPQPRKTSNITKTAVCRENNLLPILTTTESTARSHIVLGRGDVGGIWADLDKDFNQTLSYQEHMELPLYSFAEFLRDHPEKGEALDRPLRSTVSAYYKAYIKKIGIQSNFSNYTTVTGIYHLKDLENHCCCSLDPKLRSQGKCKVSSLNTVKTPEGRACKTCAPFRYAVMGYVETSFDKGLDSHGLGDFQSRKKKTRFLIRSKTVVLATGTFDQPKKLPAVSAHPCSPPCTPTRMIQQTFHDTRQLEEWMECHNSPVISSSKASSAAVFEVSPSLSPSTDSSTSPSITSPSFSSISSLSTSSSQSSASTSSLSSLSSSTSLQTPTPQSALPIVIVGTGLSAADAILLIQEKQPWRRIIHIYKHFTASEPSPLKRCHRDVYPEYASIWVKMKKFATLKNSVQAYSNQSRTKDGNNNISGAGHCSVFGEQSKDACVKCQALKTGEFDDFSPLCSGCAYKGLPDSSISNWDPVTGEITIILGHGVVIKERAAAVGVFIGKQVHMGFLKGSLAHEMLSTGDSNASRESRGGIGSGKRGSRGQRNPARRCSLNEPVEIPTPPCTPPRSPVLRPVRPSFWQKQAFQAATRDQGSIPDEEGSHVRNDNDNVRLVGKAQVESSDEEEEEEDVVDESQVLTLIRPLVSDMYNFRVIPTGIPMSEVKPSSIVSASTPTISETSIGMALPAYPVKPKKCTRLPCYPIRRTDLSMSPATCVSLLPSGTEESNDITKEKEDKKAIDTSLPMNDSEQGSSTASSSNSGSEERTVAILTRRTGLGINTALPMSCISMPCSPLLGCKILCPDLSTPPMFTLYSTAASAVSSAMAALMPTSLTTCSSSASSTISSSSSSPTTSCSTLSLISQYSNGMSFTNDDSVEEECRSLNILKQEQQDECSDSEEEEEEEEEEYVIPLMDQSIYAAGAITGSKFVRYVLGNGVAIVADILRNE
ncbi:Oxidative stress-induced growth inhibitor 2 [Haplosporangium sp. Z 27]|nr:Oxidative stress-induced growth inhibitor 2 [Haplosporangium sp. Z 27]